MEKVLVLSDSHGDIRTIKKIIKREKDCKTVIHLGDHCFDMDEVKDLTKDRKVYMVRGNCDWAGAETEELLDILGLKVLITHGHFYGVKYTYSELIYRARELEADLVLFGHTHEHLDIENEGLRLYNPGTASRRTYGDPGYAILYVTANKKYAIEQRHLNNEKNPFGRI